MSTVLPAVSEPYQQLVDDAAIFPPGDLPLPEAVAAHEQHLQAEYAGLVGPFVVSDLRLAELLTVVISTSRERRLLGLSVVVTGGAGAINSALRRTTRSNDLELQSLEIALRDDDTGALAHNARRIVAAVDAEWADPESPLTDQLPVYVEMPRLHGPDPTASWLDAADQLALVDLRLKFRTGGLEPVAFPSSAELASTIAAALDRELAFKCTAGLHNAVRHRDPQTGCEHHGFLNVLLATRASLDGASADEVCDILDEADPSAVVKLVEEAGNEALVSARRWFTSFGSCSVLEPWEDLVTLGLVAR